MRPQSATLALTAADSNGICEAQTPTVAGALDIDGDLLDTVTGAADLGGPRLLVYSIIATGGNDVDRIVTVTGTARDGDVLTENITVTVEFEAFALDQDGICESQSPTDSGALTMNGDYIDGDSGDFLGDGTWYKVTIDSAADESGRNFTITGTDSVGGALVETIDGVNNGEVTTTGAFQTVTAVAIDDASTGAITVGILDAVDQTLTGGSDNEFATVTAVSINGATNDSFVLGTSQNGSSWPLHLDPWQTPFTVTLYVNDDTAPSSNSAEVIIQYTADDPFAPTVSLPEFEESAAWVDLATVGSGDTPFAMNLAAANGTPIVARSVRVTVNPAGGQITGGSYTFQSAQAGGGG